MDVLREAAVYLQVELRYQNGSSIQVPVRHLPHNEQATEADNLVKEFLCDKDYHVFAVTDEETVVVRLQRRVSEKVLKADQLVFHVVYPRDPEVLAPEGPEGRTVPPFHLMYRIETIGVAEDGVFLQEWPLGCFRAVVTT